MIPSDRPRHPLRTLAAALLLAACGPPEADPPDAQPAPAPSAGTPISDWTAGIVERPATVAGVATLTSVRIARHDGFDRVVFEFPGQGLPGYHIEYIDRPVRQCGSGNVVEIAGDGWLEIRMEPAQAHTDEGQPTVTQRAMSPGLPIIREAELTCDFEGQVTWVLGVSSPNRYRVQELSAPPRLVVDVRH